MSEIRATTISDSAGTGPITLTGQYAPKAWINFNGSGTIAIRTSENCASIVDVATGRYSVNLTSAMSSVDFCTVDTSAKTYNSDNTSPYSGSVSTPSTASQAHVVNGNEYEGTSQKQDCDYVGLAALGDLA